MTVSIYYCLRLVLKSTKNNVTTLTMNNPKKLNGWSGPMMLTLKDRSVSAHGQAQTQVMMSTLELDLTILI